MSTHAAGRLTELQTEGPCPFLLRSPENRVTIHGRAEWISKDEAYVLVPYGTARSLQECWTATAYVPDRESPGRSQELQMRAQLVSAEAVHSPESDTEGLLLRLTRMGEGRNLNLVHALPPT